LEGVLGPGRGAPTNHKAPGVSISQLSMKPRPQLVQTRSVVNINTRGYRGYISL
jgi:hypothetical protein